MESFGFETDLRTHTSGQAPGWRALANFPRILYRRVLGRSWRCAVPKLRWWWKATMMARMCVAINLPKCVWRKYGEVIQIYQILPQHQCSPAECRKLFGRYRYLQIKHFLPFYIIIDPSNISTNTFNIFNLFRFISSNFTNHKGQNGTESVSWMKSIDGCLQHY